MEYEVINGHVYMWQNTENGLWRNTVCLWIQDDAGNFTAAKNTAKLLEFFDSQTIEGFYV